MAHHEIHHSHADSSKEHEIKAELISRLQSYYTYHEDSLVGHFGNWIKSLFNPSLHPVIDTSNYSHPDINSISKRQHIPRTVFALKKIKEFNHHFFNSEEERILNPMPAGVLAHTERIAFAGFDAAFMTGIWATWNWNYRVLGIFGAVLAGQMVLMRAPNFFNENFIQRWRRRKLAKHYLKEYGPEFFHEINNPAYDLDKLRHLENKLHHH